jgi:hypothetical protein
MTQTEMQTDCFPIISTTSDFSGLTSLPTPLAVNITPAPLPSLQCVCVTWHIVTWSPLCHYRALSPSISSRYHHLSDSPEFTIEPAILCTARPFAPVSHDAINWTRYLTVTWSDSNVEYWALFLIQHYPIFTLAFHWPVLLPYNPKSSVN